MTARPLQGLRVLDCSIGLAGQQATGLLADYGADVIWVEPPEGASTRGHDPGATSVFNRGKRGVTLDVTQARDKDRLYQLAARSDVFVESWGPGRAETFGLGFKQLHARNPQLVHCSLSGFGEEGPYRDMPAHEALVHAMLGSMEVQAGHRDGPIFQGMPFAATGAAQLAVVGILAALFRRFEDGVGRRVETSLLDGAMAFHGMLWGESDRALSNGVQSITGKSIRGASTMRLVTRSFQCSDGEYLGVHTGAVGAFGRLMKVLGLDDRIPPTESGVDMGVLLTPEQAALLETEIYGIFSAHPRAYWVQRMIEADICAVEHLPPGAVLDEPQARHNSMVAVIDDPVLGRVEQVAPGIRFDGAAPRIKAAAPTPGQHNQIVFDALDAPDTPTVWRANLPTPSAPDHRPLLDGVKIVDLGAYYAGPYSSRLLADFGADVIKLETTVGDPLRGIERPFFGAQAGKRALAANLKDAGLSEAVRQLIGWADIVHHNMRPGAAERLGLGADQIRALNPAAIYLYAPGWGTSGPHMMRQSFAPMLSGYVGASYEVGGQYNEPLPATGNEDPGNGLLGAIALLIALLHRRITGAALACENPQLNAAMGMMAHVVRTDDGEAVGAGLLDVFQMGVGALESLYETGDGWICVVAREEPEIRALERALDVHILEDDRFATADLRRANRDLLTEVLRDTFETRTTRDWLDILSKTGAPAMAPAGASCIHDVMHDPLHRKLGRVAEVTHPELGKVREFARLVRVSDATMKPHHLAPGLGEHTDEILAWLGYTAEEVGALRVRGSIR